MTEPSDLSGDPIDPLTAAWKQVEIREERVRIAWKARLLRSGFGAAAAMYATLVGIVFFLPETRDRAYLAAVLAAAATVLAVSLLRTVARGHRRQQDDPSESPLLTLAREALESLKPLIARRGGADPS